MGLGRLSCLFEIVGVDSSEEIREVVAGELPLKRSGGGLVAILEGKESPSSVVEIGEVVGSEELALENREVDLDLVQPGGVYGQMDET